MLQKIGVIGLSVMGKNLALNIESNGYDTAVYNRTYEVTEEFLKEANGKNVIGTETVKEFVQALEKPRRIFIMVKAGPATDSLIEQVRPHLSEGDILIDGGNAYFNDTIRRQQELNASGIHLIGTGVSGGEEGALKGPSMMPGGDKSAYELVEPVFRDISAKVNGDACSTYIGPGGAGHYVKMVHNGIEYGDMQLITEAYALMKDVLGLDAEALSQVFSQWNKGELNSYLIEITADIFTVKDEETGQPLIEMILDTAEQKGTGKWTSKDSLDIGVPLSIITDSVYQRFLSSKKEERIQASRVLKGPSPAPLEHDTSTFVEKIRRALFASKICSYAQGFSQMKMASEEYEWELNYGNIAMIFRGGCIIRAHFLQNIKDAFEKDPHLTNLLLDSYFQSRIDEYQDAWREVVAEAAKRGIPVPGMASALAYYDSYRSESLPANLLQAQRDYFGAHQYQRKDKAGHFHTQWLDG